MHNPDTHSNTRLYTQRQDKIVAVAGLIVLSLALRPAIVSIGPVLLLIRERFELSYSQASLLTTIPDICMGVFALLAPRVAGKFGVDRSIVGALALLGVAVVGRAMAPSVLLLLTCTTLVGIGIAISGALIGGWIKSHFPGHAAFFVGIYAGGLSIGATIAAVFTEPLARLMSSWRGGAGAWSILCVTGIMSWMVLAKRFNNRASGSSQQLPVSHALPWRNLEAWLIAGYFGFSQFVLYALFAWLAPAAREMKISTLQPGILLGLFTLVFAAACLGMGALPTKAHDRRIWLAASSAIAAAGIAAMTFAPNGFPTLSVVVMAAGLGMAFTLGMTLPLDYVATAHEAGSWTVFTLFIGYLIAALGPFCFGTLRDHTGSYARPFLLLFAILFLMLCMTPALRPTRTASQKNAIAAA